MPRGPASWGPIRLCIQLMTLNRKTMPRMSAVVGTTALTTSTLISVESQYGGENAASTTVIGRCHPG